VVRVGLIGIGCGLVDGSCERGTEPSVTIE
jgi:hypothetical protein